MWDGNDPEIIRTNGSHLRTRSTTTGKVVGGYEPREPNNWGRWGDDDQRGTQNLIGPEQARRRRPPGAQRQGLLAGAADRPPTAPSSRAGPRRCCCR